MKRKKIVESILTQERKSKEDNLQRLALRYVSDETLEYLTECIESDDAKGMCVSEFPEPYKTDCITAIKKAAEELGIPFDDSE